MIPKTYVDFYGDETRWFMGVVVDAYNDPKKLGRIKVRVFGVYDNIEDKDLPWSQIVVPITQGIHEGKGQNLGILNGTQVFGVFLDGKNSQLPMVIGTVPKVGDTNAKAEENYPHNKVYETERGHCKEYDDTEGKERIKEYHTSGTYYEMDKDGRMIIHAKGDVTVVADNANVEITGNDVTITGNVRINGEVSVSGDVNTDLGVSLNKHTHMDTAGTAIGKTTAPNV